MDFFGKKLPAWLLLGALVIVGAGAATGLVLKDQLTGTTTIAVSQALEITSVTGSGGDEFLGTINDNGVEWAAHFEANNGDQLELELTVYNNAGQDMWAELTMDVPDGITVNIEGDDDADENVVQIALYKWKFLATAGDSNTLDISFALEDAQPTGFYDIPGVIIPVNV